MRRLRASWPVTALTVAFFAVYADYAVSRQATYLTAGYDLGIFDQAVRNYARFRAPLVPLKGIGYNIFADHFHPIIATAAPLYWIWPNPIDLLVLQAALIAASVPIVHGFAARRMSSSAALVVAASYGLGWAVQGMVDFDFHEIAYAVPLLAAAIDALDRDDDRWLLITGGLLLLVREDMGVLVAIVGVLRLLRGPRAARRTRRTRAVGGSMVVAGVVAYFVTTSLVIPAFAPTGQFSYWTFDALGRNAPDALGNIVSHPSHAISVFFTPSVKVQTMAYLLVPLALLPFRSRYALLAVPLFAERFFNSREHLWTTQFHYNVLPWLVLVLAMVDGAARLGIWRRLPLRAVLLGYLAVVPVYVVIEPGPTAPAIQRLLTGAAWRTTARERAQQAAVAAVPRDVCVSVDDRLAPHLTGRDRVTLPGVPTPRTDYYVLDLSEQEVGYLLPTPQSVLARATADGYQVVLARGTMRVLRSPDFTGPSPLCSP
jgi:uncharacterized membrane protein